MNKKAQLDDTLVWGVAFVVIFFILMIYIAGVVGIFPSDFFKGNNLEVTGIEDDLPDLEKLKFIQKFADDHNTDVSAWVDEDISHAVMKEIMRDYFNTLPVKPHVKIFANSRSVTIQGDPFNNGDSIYFFFLTGNRQVVGVEYNG